MYVADLSSEGLTDMPGLQFSGIRATRARYPNGGIGGFKRNIPPVPALFLFPSSLSCQEDVNAYQPPLHASHHCVQPTP